MAPCCNLSIPSNIHRYGRYLLLFLLTHCFFIVIRKSTKSGTDLLPLSSYMTRHSIDSFRKERENEKYALVYYE
jgi:hypothetical protein